MYTPSINKGVIDLERRKDDKRRVLKEGESQRKDGAYDFRWRTSDGKRHSIYAKTLEELRKKEEAIRRDKSDGIKTGNPNITINDIYELWLHLKRGLKDNTFKNYQYMYNQFVYDGFGRTRLCKLKRSDVRRFYNKLVDTDGLKIATVDNIHTVLHQVLNLAVEDDYIRYNPADNALKELRQVHNCDTEKKKALTIAEQQLFLDFLKRNHTYSHWYPIFAVMLGTGMRVGEITGLRWQDIDFDKNTISVNHTLVYYNKGDNNGCSFAINTPKSKAGWRTIPMTEDVRNAIIAEREYQQFLDVSCNVSIDTYTDFVFVNRFGNVQHQGTLNKALRRIIRDCNEEVISKNKGSKDLVLLPKFSCHILRHTFTTRLCEAGVNVKIIQDVLGHSDISTTMNIYADATKEMKDREFNTFEEYLKSFKQIS